MGFFLCLTVLGNVIAACASCGDQIRISFSTMSPLRGFIALVRRFRGLAPPAKECRPFGAILRLRGFAVLSPGIRLGCVAILLSLASLTARGGEQWIVFEGGDGPGRGKHIVLISGDEEYRSEEALPQLAKILSKHHGFKCTVLFAIDPKTGVINPNQKDNIPGLEALETADLMIIFTRFRDLPDEQMKHIVDYVESGRPIIGIRTATHAFDIKPGKTYAKYSWNDKGKEWNGGFGRQVLGETWINHHGQHGKQSTRGIIAEGMENHPITQGIKDGDIWGPTDVYGVGLPLPGDSKPVVLGQVLTGMKKDDKPLEGKKNDPMMPIAWIKTYTGKSGKTARVFTSTIGASQDLLSEGVRRMFVNACYWTLGMEEQLPDNPDKAKVDLVGEYKPSGFAFGGFVKDRRPEDYQK